ncbi:hypothetical protein DL769_008649 [Monosporascus sp. CRB-8-3]|nr:hypothetical protein DL769_008649 [Monosporascus sp. CRB-8-3]
MNSTVSADPWRNAPATGYHQDLWTLSSRVYAWAYLFEGPSIIQAGFDRSKGKSFEVLAPDNRYVFVTTQAQIKELDSAPDTMLQPVYTMHGFNWFDRRGTEGVGFIRALRTLLVNNLPDILPSLSPMIRARFEQLHLDHTQVDGMRQSPVYPMVVNIVVLINAVSFFGGSIVPSLVGGVLAYRLKSHAVVYETLLAIAEERCQERDQRALGQKTPKHADCIQWIMDTSPQKKPWTAKRVVHEVMAIWFGSVHALSTTITFAIHDICLYPEYVAPLREELKNDYDAFERTGKGLGLLDSFIKESARLTPVESMSTRRSALQPFKFTDGTKLAIGDWACTPVRAIMTDATNYPAPLDFKGFRFADQESLDRLHGNFTSPQPKPSKLTDVDNTWHVWGTGRMACPGRFYASAVMKAILGQIIMHYDCELAQPDADRWFTWRSTMLPKHDTMVIFTPR